jgi:superfamily II DNA or RNA helicase
MILRPYQTAMTNQAREALRTHRGVLLQMPTGSGKTPTACHIIQRAVARGKNVLFLAHRAELLKQASNKLDAFNVPHGIIRSGKHMTLSKQVQVASVQTLVRRLDYVRFLPHLIFVDEAHLSAAPTYKKILATFPEAYVVGLTATPMRLDGMGLSRAEGCHFDHLITGPTFQELIDQKYLVPMRCFTAAHQIDLSGIGAVGGDFNQGKLAAVVDKSTITGDAVSHWIRIASGRKTLVFCVSIEHAQHVSAQFNAAGINSVAVDGGWTDENREGAMRDFEAGKIQVLVNCHLFIEGLDIPEVSCIVNLAPTMSVARFLQKAGRGSRPFDGKTDCIFLDHGSDIARHGLPTDERKWSLEGRIKKKRSSKQEIPIRICPACFAANPGGTMVCRECGHEWAIEARQVETIDGELVEWVRPPPGPSPARVEEWQARTVEQLTELGRVRGYSNPAGWAHIRYQARMRKAGA